MSCVRVIVSSKEKKDSEYVAKRHKSLGYLSGFFLSSEVSSDESKEKRKGRYTYRKTVK